MTKSNTKFFELDRRESDGQLVNVLIKGQKDMPTIKIGSQNSMDILDAQSALRAVSDFYRFHLYDHPQTTSNLHFYAKVGVIAQLFRETNIGVVGTQYAGSLPIPVPHESEFKTGWAQVNVRNQRFYLSPFTQKYEDARSRKHDFVEACVLGYGFEIRVLPFNSNKSEEGYGLADKIVASWLEEDDEKAAAMRIEGFNRAQSREFMQDGIRNAKKANGGVMPAPEAIVSRGQPVNGGIILTTIEGEVIDITKFSNCVVIVHDGRDARYPVSWDGSAYARAQLAQVASAKGWLVEIKQ